MRVIVGERSSAIFFCCMPVTGMLTTTTSVKPPRLSSSRVSSRECSTESRLVLVRVGDDLGLSGHA